MQPKLTKEPMRLTAAALDKLDAEVLGADRIFVPTHVYRSLIAAARASLEGGWIPVTERPLEQAWNEGYRSGVRSSKDIAEGMEPDENPYRKGDV